jgi:hypothetical protein
MAQPSPEILAIDSHDTVYVLEGQSVSRLTPGNAPEPYIGPVTAPFPNIIPFSAIASGPADTLYLVVSNVIGRVLEWPQNGKGGGVHEFGVSLTSITVDAGGNVYGSGGGKLVGFGSQIFAFGFSGDGGPLGSAVFSSDLRVIFVPTGDFYVLDNGNRRIRKISIFQP